MRAIEAIYNGTGFEPKQPIPVQGECEVIITFLDSKKTKTKSRRQGEALDRLIFALDEITDEPFDAEWDEIIAQRTAVGNRVGL